MFPVDFYQAVQADRHARLGRLARRARRSSAPAPASPASITVTDPSGRVVLTPDGVIALDTPLKAARR